jgi:hypothetical protein
MPSEGVGVFAKLPFFTPSIEGCMSLAQLFLISVQLQSALNRFGSSEVPGPSLYLLKLRKVLFVILLNM